MKNKKTSYRSVSVEHLFILVILLIALHSGSVGATTEHVPGFMGTNSSNGNKKGRAELLRKRKKLVNIKKREKIRCRPLVHKQMIMGIH